MNWSFENLEIAPAIQADETTSRHVHWATRMLQTVVGKSARRLRVKWSITSASQLQLTLSDSTGEVSTVFTVAELSGDFSLRRRLSDLWNDLLDVRMDIQMDRILHPEDEVAVS
jgi:hypothetical protein